MRTLNRELLLYIAGTIETHTAKGQEKTAEQQGWFCSQEVTQCIVDIRTIRPPTDRATA
ncbi:MAG: hypothetical protein COB27_010520 [Moritella sp.]|uniref:hypothetical protein n=1 Tax=Moritella sp. TaxID=78556 RepID=UPI002173C8A2|nr:hypothetical protein [Moritella sp.]MBL1417296.1 hypothetical protein [Moritella sp.]